MYRIQRTPALQLPLFQRNRYLVQISHKPPSSPSEQYRRWWCSPRRDAQRNEAAARQRFLCGHCGYVLGRWYDVHHANGYDNLGYEEASDLVAVHRRCHRQLEDEKRRAVCGCRAA